MSYNAEYPTCLRDRHGNHRNPSRRSLNECSSPWSTKALRSWRWNLFFLGRSFSMIFPSSSNQSNQHIFRGYVTLRRGKWLFLPGFSRLENIYTRNKWWVCHWMTWFACVGWNPNLKKNMIQFDQHMFFNWVARNHRLDSNNDSCLVFIWNSHKGWDLSCRSRCVKPTCTWLFLTTLVTPPNKGRYLKGLGKDATLCRFLENGMLSYYTMLLGP